MNQHIFRIWIAVGFFTVIEQYARLQKPVRCPCLSMSAPVFVYSPSGNASINSFCCSFFSFSIDLFPISEVSCSIAIAFSLPTRLAACAHPLSFRRSCFPCLPKTINCSIAALSLMLPSASRIFVAPFFLPSCQRAPCSVCPPGVFLPAAEVIMCVVSAFSLSRQCSL